MSSATRGCNSLFCRSNSISSASTPMTLLNQTITYFHTYLVKPKIHLTKPEKAPNNQVCSSLQMMIFCTNTILQLWSINRCFLTSIHLKSNMIDRASHNPKYITTSATSRREEAVLRERVHRRIGRIRNQSFIMQMRVNKRGISQLYKKAWESCLCLRCRLISEQLQMLRLLPSITNLQSRGRDPADRTGSTILKCSEINEIEASSYSRRK